MVAEFDEHPRVPGSTASGADEGADGERPGGESDDRPWLPSPPQIQRLKDPQAVAEAAARRFHDAARRAVERSERCLVVLAGGSTPRETYRRLAESPFRERVPWPKTFFVFSDERCVPPDDPQSNYRMVRETLLEPLQIPDHQVLRMKGEQTPADAARRYEVRLGDLFLNQPRRRFDLALLGIGTDGHTASLFPETAALEEQEHWVVANHVPRLDAWRLTLTFPALNSARHVVFLATGEEKARVVAEAFGGLEHASPHPCERVLPLHARRDVLLDRAAAACLPPREGAVAAPADDPPRAERGRRRQAR